MKLNLNTGLSALPKIGAGGVTPFPNTKSTSFDGTDDYVDIGLDKPSELNLTGDMSISAWINLDTVAVGTKVIVCDLDSGGSISQFCFEVNRTAGKLSVLSSGSGVALTSSTSLSTGTWYHVVMTRSGSSFNWDYNIYLDGSNDGSANTTTNFQAQQGCAIGRFGNYNGGYFDGKIDEVSIWNIELTSAQVSDLYNSGTPTNLAGESGLVAWYRMGDSATFNANSQWEIPEQTKINNWSSHSFDFDGVDDYIDLGVLPYLNSASAFSISTWIRPSSVASGDKLVFAVVTDANNRLWIDLIGSSIACGVANGSNTYQTLATGIVINTWYHLVLVFDGTATGADRVTLYLDGAAQTTTLTTWPSTTPTFTTSSFIGSYDAAPSYIFPGMIDETAIFDTALTSGNVTSIYNSGEPVDVTGLSISGLQGYWRMGEGADWNNTNWQVPDYSKNALFSQQSFEFDNVDDYITMGDVLDFDYNEAFTLSAWINIDPSPANAEIFLCKQLDSGDYTGYGLLIDGSGSTAYLKFNLVNTLANRIQVKGTTDLATSTWHHVVMTYDGSSSASGVTFYINGSSESVTTPNDTLSATTVSSAPLNIGSRNNGNAPFGGLIDSVSIWDAELTSGNVTSIYNSGEPNDVSGLGISGLVGWWKMGEDATFSTNWTIPDASTNSNDGTSANMDEVDKKYISPGNEARGESSGMDVTDNINNAPDNESQGLSVGMVSGSIVTDVP